MLRAMPIALGDLAARVPRHWRRRVPMRLRNALVDRFGHPTGAFDATAHPRRLNLGAGWDIRPGYLNVDLNDFHSPDLVGDARSLPELPSGRYEEIIAQDILEHLERADGPKALQEWRRLLAPGGRLWLRVPDLPSLLRWLEQDETADRHREIMHFMFGTQAYNGDFHLAGYTDVLLCDELMRAGLERPQLELRDDWLWEGEAFAPDGVVRPRVGLAWGPGFYRRELGDEGRTWRWGAREASLLLYAPEAVDVVLEWDVEIGSGSIEGAGVSHSFAPGRQRVPLSLAAGGNRLRFSVAEALAIAEDPRELALRFGEAIVSPAAPTAAT
jgi:SAM-dependent methyltransferase